MNTTIRTWRIAAGLSQAQLARAVYRSPGAVSGWECGRWRPDMWAAMALERLSDGVLRAADWYPEIADLPPAKPPTDAA